MRVPAAQTFLPARDYDLATTLASAQAFRWREREGGWEGIIQDRWVRLRPCDGGIAAETATAQRDWCWLNEYLQRGLDFSSVLRTFPDDFEMHLRGQCTRPHRAIVPKRSGNGRVPLPCGWRLGCGSHGWRRRSSF